MSHAASAAAPSPTASGELSHRQITTILIGLMMGMFLAALDQNVFGTAIKTIADDLNGYSAQAWVTTAYLITSTITTPLYGKLSDMYGRKPFFMTAIVIFVAGSLACTFATSMYSLAALRAVQGIGAGGLFSLALAIIGDIVPPRERAKYQGYFLAVFGTSSVLGPIIGGFFAGTDSLLGLAGWRWIFLVNVPVGVAALVVVFSTLHLHHHHHRARIDWWGVTALVVGLVPLLIVAEQGRNWGWISTETLLLGGLGFLGLVAFVLIEHRMGDAALIPLRIFKSRTIAIAISGSFVLGAGLFGGMLLIPQYPSGGARRHPDPVRFHDVADGIGTDAGLGAVGTADEPHRTPEGLPDHWHHTDGGGAVTVQHGHRLHPALAGDGLHVPAGAGAGQFPAASHSGSAGCRQPTEIGMATSSATFFRQIGGTLGVAVFLSVLFDRLPGNIASAIQSATRDPAFLAALKDPQLLANPANAAFAKAVQSQDLSTVGNVMDNTSLLNQLAPVFSHPFKVGFSDSMDTVFLMGAAVCLVGLVVLWFLPNLELSNQSAAARLAQERADGGQDSSANPTRAGRGITDDLSDMAAMEAAGHTLWELTDPDQEDIVEPTAGQGPGPRRAS